MSVEKNWSNIIQKKKKNEMEHVNKITNKQTRLAFNNATIKNKQVYHFNNKQY